MISNDLLVFFGIIVTAIATIVGAIIKFRPIGSKKTIDMAVVETKIEHIEQHIERLEKNVSKLSEGNITHNIEIDKINGIIEEIKNEVQKLR